MPPKHALPRVDRLKRATRAKIRPATPKMGRPAGSFRVGPTRLVRLPVHIIVALKHLANLQGRTMLETATELLSSGILKAVGGNAEIAKHKLDLPPDPK